MFPWLVMSKIYDNASSPPPLRAFSKSFSSSHRLARLVLGSWMQSLVESLGSPAAPAMDDLREDFAELLHDVRDVAPCGDKFVHDSRVRERDMCKHGNDVPYDCHLVRWSGSR